MKNSPDLFIKLFFILGLSVFVVLSFPMLEPGKNTSVLANGKAKGKDKDKKEKENKKEEKDDKKDQKDAAREARKAYQEALKVLKKKDYKGAIVLFQKAIEYDPQSADEYYPYVQLGLIYLTLGDVDKAQQYCEQERAKGVASKDTVDQCLTVIIKLTPKEPEVRPEPTEPPELIEQPEEPTPLPEPEPTAELEPPTSEDFPPAIAITSDVPERIESATLTITGMITDDHGIADLKIRVRKPDTKAIVAALKVQQVEETFETTVPLELGQNEIVIEATDTAGQIATRMLNVLRNRPRPAQTEPADPRAVEEPVGETAAETTPAQREVYAVIIGIGQFQDPRIPPLRFTANDARGMYDILIDPNHGGVPADHVQLLIDEEATTRNVKKAIGTWLSEQARADDTVIIYYSGHGAPEKEEKYWVTFDADMDDLYSSALSNRAIHDMLARVESKRMITLLDSCYSAATVNLEDRTRNIKVEVPWGDFAGEGNVTLSASNGAQLSLEMEAYEHGVFTYYLLEGLKGRADGAAGPERDGIVEVEEVWNYVKQNVTDTAKKRGNTQTPVLQGALTAGIPLTYDLAYLEELERKRMQAKQAKQAKVQELFEQKKIPANLFDCAFNMLEAGQSDGYLEGLLADEISPETFSRLFTCKTAQ